MSGNSKSKKEISQTEIFFKAAKKYKGQIKVNNIYFKGFTQLSVYGVGPFTKKDHIWDAVITDLDEFEKACSEGKFKEGKILIPSDCLELEYDIKTKKISGFDYNLEAIKEGHYIFCTDIEEPCENKKGCIFYEALMEMVGVKGEE